jgi:uncharacterized membrane protein YfcA
MILSFFIVYLICGALIGFLAGLFGIGGGIIGIPLLLIFFKMQGMSESIAMHMAIGTSLAVVVVTSIASIYSHYQKGVILFPVLKKIVWGAVLGSLLGVIIANQITGDWLQRIFGIFLLLIAVKMFFNKEIKLDRQLPSIKYIFPVTALLGAISGMLGLGGGVLMIPYLSWAGVPIRNAIGTATACVLPVALVGASGYMLTKVELNTTSLAHSGFIYWPAFFGISIASVLFAPLGVRVGHLISTTLLKKLFAGLVLLVGVGMLI